MLIRITNPKSDHYIDENILAKDTPEYSMSLQVFDKKAPKENGYLILGEPYNSGTELVKSVTKSDKYVKTNGILQLANTTRQNHLQGTKIYWTPFKYVTVEKSDDNITWFPMNDYEIEWDKPQTVIFDDSATYYRYSFKNIFI